MVQLGHTVLVFDVLKGTAEPSNVTACHLNVALTKNALVGAKSAPPCIIFEAINGGGVNRPGALKENLEYFCLGKRGTGLGQVFDQS